MKPNPPEVLFAIEKETPRGTLRLVAWKRADARIVVDLTENETHVAVSLGDEHTIALAASLLAAVPPEAIGRFAEQMDQHICQTIAAGFLVPTATRGVLALPGAPEAS